MSRGNSLGRWVASSPRRAHLSNDRATLSLTLANMVLRDPSEKVGSGGAPSAAFIPTRLTMAAASVSRIIPWSSISSSVT